MRLIVTADLHFNHGHSKPLAIELIEKINRTAGDVLLVIGDTAVADGPELEQALSLFTFRGPKLFVAGNHELWTKRDDSLSIFREELPARVRALGWHWLEDDPFVIDDIAIVGSVGWYDYSFAVPELEIDSRFYEAKIAPGVAERLEEHKHLIHGDESPAALDVIARWNDGKFVKLGQSDSAFTQDRLESLSHQLDAHRDKKSIIAAIHTVPLPQLLPPRRGMQWDFARAYLGSPRIGELLLSRPNVSHILCGHSHWPMETTIDSVRAINIGSGYRAKIVRELDV